MKKQKFNKKLSLNKSTISNLSREDMKVAHGGNLQQLTLPNEGTTCIPYCATIAGVGICVSIPYTYCQWCPPEI